jgi:hypothetical protein
MEIILRDDWCGGKIPLPVLPQWCLFEERALRSATDPACLVRSGLTGWSSAVRAGLLLNSGSKVQELATD